MTNIIKIPARTQGYLFAVRDEAADKFDVKRYAWPYSNALIPVPWAYWKMEEDGCATREDATGNGHNLVPRDADVIWPTYINDGAWSPDTLYQYLTYTFIDWTAELKDEDGNVIASTGGSGEPSWDIAVTVPLYSGPYGTAPYYMTNCTVHFWNDNDPPEEGWYYHQCDGIVNESWGSPVFPPLKRCAGGSWHVDYKDIIETRWQGSIRSYPGYLWLYDKFTIEATLRYLPDDPCPGVIAGKSGNGLMLDWEDRWIDGDAMPVWSEDPRFTFAFWVYMASDPDSIGAEFNFGTEYNDVNVHGFGDSFYGFSFDANVPGLYVESDYIYAEGWHFICLYYDGTGLYLEVDNGLVDSDLGSWEDYGVDLGPWSIWPWVDHSEGYDASHGVGFDEVGIWLVALTEAQRTYLYNSGAGRTLYP